MPESEVDRLFEMTSAGQVNLTVDLEKNTVTDGAGWSQSFEIEPTRRHNLLNGLDDIALTLTKEEKISAYEERHPLPSIS